MTKWLAIALLIASSLMLPAQQKNPLSQPHWTFFNQSGAACAGCYLYTYAAGTTTPLATYTDSSGSSVNTNPIVLGVAGDAAIWVGTSSLKLVLEDTTHTTIWTADNIAGGGSGATPCSPASTIQIANSTLDGFTCDSLITIDTAAHTINVGGSLPATHFTLGNLGTIASSWTFDVSSPLTAAASLAPIPLTDLSTQAADSLVMNATGSSAIPTAVTMPAACTTALNYDTTTHTWSCASVAVAPFALSSLATQAADTVVMNAGATTAAPTAVALPSSCAYGVNYSTTSHTWTCVATPPTDTYFSITGCTIATEYNGDAACQATGSLGFTAPDTSYMVLCNASYTAASGTSYIGISVSTKPLSTTSFTYTEGATYGNGASAADTPTPTLQCHYHHN